MWPGGNIIKISRIHPLRNMNVSTKLGQGQSFQPLWDISVWLKEDQQTDRPAIASMTLKWTESKCGSMRKIPFLIPTVIKKSPPAVKRLQQNPMWLWVFVTSAPNLLFRSEPLSSGSGSPALPWPPKTTLGKHLLFLSQCPPTTEVIYSMLISGINIA